MYTNEEMLASIKKVEANRAANAAYEPARMTAEQKDEVLKTYHPDYIESQFEDLKIGPNKGEKVPTELAALLFSRLTAVSIPPRSTLSTPSTMLTFSSSAAAEQVLPQLSRLTTAALT